MSVLDLAKAYSLISYETLKDKLHSKTTTNISDEDKKILIELELNGVAVLPDYYTKEQCNTIIAEIDGMITDDSVKKWTDKESSDTRIYGSHQYSANIMNFHTDPKLTSIGECYTNCELINSHTLGAKLVPKENNLGSGQGWHRDSVYRIQYKSIVYLTNVNENNGPFEYILGSHKISTIYNSILVNKFNAHQNRIEESQIEAFLKSNKQLEKKVFTASKGSVILVDTRGIHRGMPIKEGNRYALTNYFMPKHHFTPSVEKKWKELM